MFRKLYAFLLLFAVVVLSGCGAREIAQPEEASGAEIAAAEISADQIIEQWVEDSKEIFLAQSRELDGVRYILVTYGQRESDGYNVEITETAVLEDHVRVLVTFTRPGNADYNDIITYPYALAEIPATDLPVRFFAAGDEITVPQPEGVDYIPAVAGSSPGLVLFSPAPESSVGKEFIVEGIAGLAEGSLIYRITDENDKVLFYGVTSAFSQNWKYFRLDVVLDASIPETDTIYLELVTEGSGPPPAASVKIPLLLDY